MGAVAGLVVALLIIIGFVGLVMLMSTIRGFVFAKMWSWFIVPFGAPEISIWWAIGIAATVTLLTARLTPDEEHEARTSEEKWAKVGKLFIHGTVGPFVALGFAWLIHWMMIH